MKIMKAHPLITFLITTCSTINKDMTTKNKNMKEMKGTSRRVR